MSDEWEVTLAPGTEGISNVTFDPSGTSLLVSSWDAAVTLYDLQQKSLRAAFRVHSAPVLDCCYADGTRIVSAGADGFIKMVDLSTGEDTPLAVHGQPAQCVEYCATRSAVVSAGWDKQLMLSDPRQPALPPGSQQNTFNACAPLPDKAYALDVSADKVVVGMAGRHVYVYDVRNLSEPQQRRESSLKYQTRCIRCMPDGTGYGLSSIEGRVAMEYFSEEPQAQAQKYAFKCHRETVDGIDTVHPVNAIAFHPHHGTFATGGCDGVVNMWDGARRKRLGSQQYSNSVASLAFSPKDSTLAVALSYTFQHGEPKISSPSQIDKLFVRRMTEQEVLPACSSGKVPKRDF